MIFSAWDGGPNSNFGPQVLGILTTEGRPRAGLTQLFARPDLLWISLIVAQFRAGKLAVLGAYSKNGDNCPMQLRCRVQTH